jgi:predicted AlkP superfamily phosphohydrolase/phosphomutase
MGGDPVMREVLTREEVYDGPYLERAPDLVCLSNPGFDLKGSIQKREIFIKTDLSGMHTQDDAFFYCDKGRACESIFDAKSTILDAAI